MAVYFVVWGVSSRVETPNLSARETEQALAARGFMNVSCAAVSNHGNWFGTETEDDYDYECSFRLAEGRSDVVLVGVDASSITTISP